MANYRISRLFSKKENNNSDKIRKVGAAITGTGLGLAVTGYEAAKAVNSKNKDEAVSSKLKEIISKKRILYNDTARTGIGPLFCPKYNIILTDTDSSTAALSHELGHADYLTNKNSGKVGRSAHKIGSILGGSNKSSKVYQPASAVALGTASGVRAALLEAEGKKQSKLERHAAWAVPATMAAPILLAEGLASRKGSKFLRESGASKELMNTARKELIGCWGAHAGTAMYNAGLGELSRDISYYLTKKKLKRDKASSSKSSKEDHGKENKVIHYRCSRDLPRGERRSGRSEV